MEIQTSSIGSLNNIQQSMQNNASNIASNNAPNIASKEKLEGGVNVNKELIEMKQSEQNFSSVVKVIEAEDDIMCTLLDLKV